MYGADPDTVYWQQQAYEWVPRILGAIAILVIVRRGFDGTGANFDFDEFAADLLAALR